MDNLLVLLENKIVVSGKEILGLRSYIEENHSKENSLFKASILANKINTIIDSNLHSCNLIEKANIRSLLIDRYLIKENKPITHFSVFNELLEYDNDLVDSQSRLNNWLSLNYKDKYVSQSLEDYIIKNRKRNFAEKKLNIDEPITTLTEANLSQKIVKTEDFIPGKEPITTDATNKTNFIANPLVYRSLVGIFLIILLVISFIFFSPSFKLTDNSSSISIMEIYNKANTDFITLTSVDGQNNIPNYLTYKNISKLKLTNYLESKQSLLANDYYLNTLYKLSNEYNINPLLLLSIIGQEQNFIPTNNIYANKIINNPYNVFGSWKSYNTNFEDSTRIVLNTITNKLSQKPYYEDPFKWLNTTYAEDELWWQGVKRIFRKLNNEVH